MSIERYFVSDELTAQFTDAEPLVLEVMEDESEDPPRIVGVLCEGHGLGGNVYEIDSDDRNVINHESGRAISFSSKDIVGQVPPFGPYDRPFNIAGYSGTLVLKTEFPDPYIISMDTLGPKPINISRSELPTFQPGPIVP